MHRMLCSSISTYLTEPLSSVVCLAVYKCVDMVEHGGSSCSHSPQHFYFCHVPLRLLKLVTCVRTSKPNSTGVVNTIFFTKLLLSSQ